MIRPQHTASANVLARVAFAGVIIGGCAVSLAAPAYAYPCDPMAISMTPHQSTACSEPGFVAPPAEVAPPEEVGLPAGVPPPTEVAVPAEAAPAADVPPVEGQPFAVQPADPALDPGYLLPQGDPAASEPDNNHAR